MRAGRAVGTIIVGVTLGACTGADLAAPRASVPPPSAEARTTSAESWAEVTRSPWPAPTARGGDERGAALAAACGAPDAALERVARVLVDRRARGLGAPEPDGVVALLRAFGEPHVRPRVLSATGRAPLDERALRDKLATLDEPGAHTRCGVAVAQTPHGGELAVAVAVDALAELAPLPIRARTGEWLSIEARVNVPARAAKLVVLGPRGAPRGVPTTFDAATGRVRARLALDRPGGFTLQIVGELPEGPRPLLEARVFADVPPPPVDVDAAPPAPGEDGSTAGDDASNLARMVGAARASDGAAPLARDRELDALARAHAERMRRDGVAAHDVGDGDARERFEAENLPGRVVGENVAHAATVALAHRALYASPSHRMNLLRADYTRFGVGVARADDGTVFVCEVFAGD